MDDWDLLEQFQRAAPGAPSEQAFGELVRRHAGFVLATCRRRLRDAHLSEDAAQAVFLVLARRPPVRWGTNASLAGWLYKTAIYACNNAMQARRTRERHERQVAAAALLSSNSNDAARVPSDVEVLLDAALAELSSKERDAVLLRYYQDQSVQEVGAALGISQNTATKRITRAVERMRQFFAGKGVAMTPLAFVDSITRATQEPAVSSEFIAQTISIGTGQSAASAAIQQIAEGVSFMVRVAQIKVVAAAAFVIVTVCGGLVGVNLLMAQDTKPPAPRLAQPVMLAMAEDPKPPATQPTATAEEPEDLTTPKGALRAFAKASRGADFAILQRVTKCDTLDNLESQMLAAANTYQKSMGELFAAVRDKFGEPAMRQFMRQRGAIPLEPFLRLIESELDQHDVVVEGDTAKLVDRKDPNTETHVKLVREDGVWKVLSTGLAERFGEEQTMRRIEMLTARAEIVRGVAAEVTAGKYENIDAVGVGLAEAIRR